MMKMIRFVLTCALVTIIVMPSSALPQGPQACLIKETCSEGGPPPGVVPGAGGPPLGVVPGTGGPPPGVVLGAGGPPPGASGGPPPCVFTGTCSGDGPPPGVVPGSGVPPLGVVPGAGGPPPGVLLGAGGPPPGASGGPPPCVFTGTCGGGAAEDQAVMPKPPSPGPCATPPVVQNFNLQRYLGRWYEIERMFNPFQSGDCVIADYSLNPNNTVRVVNSNSIEGEFDIIEGTATPAPGHEGRLNVVFPDTRGFDDASLGEVSNYNIVATDYNNYAVVYTCATFQIPGQVTETKLEFSWILNRREKASPQFMPRLKAYLDTVGIDSERYMPTNQDNCVRRPPLDNSIRTYAVPY